jgi:CBS domain-containing protein
MTIQVIMAGRDGTVFSATGDETVRQVVARLTEMRIGAVPVVDGGAVVGIFSERDVMHCLNSHGNGALDLLIRDVMTSPAITISSDTAALSALSLMSRRRIRHLPVVDNRGRSGGDARLYQRGLIRLAASQQADKAQHRIALENPSQRAIA